jgi:hypothetical protein
VVDRILRKAAALLTVNGEPMGHIRLGTLPKTQKWNQVVNLIASGGDVERIAAASADAAEHGLERAAQDEGLAHAFWLLTQIPQAARQSNFSERLWELGFTGLSSQPTLFEIVTAFTRAVDGHVRERGKRTDLGEMAQHAVERRLGMGTEMDSTAFDELIAQVRGTATALAEAKQKVAAFEAELAQQEHGAQLDASSALLWAVKPIPKRVSSGWLPVTDKPSTTLHAAASRTGSRRRRPKPQA